jgi:hypothetical protein
VLALAVSAAHRLQAGTRDGVQVAAERVVDQPEHLQRALRSVGAAGSDTNFLSRQCHVKATPHRKQAAVCRQAGAAVGPHLNDWSSHHRSQWSDVVVGRVLAVSAQRATLLNKIK